MISRADRGDELDLHDDGPRFRPALPPATLSERAQVHLGRLAILVGHGPGRRRGLLVESQPEGIYKYLNTISVYLVMPITPAIVFGIMSKRVTFAGAIASVAVGAGALGGVHHRRLPHATPASRPAGFFRWLHMPLTSNYT